MSAAFLKENTSTGNKPCRVCRAAFGWSGKIAELQKTFEAEKLLWVELSEDDMAKAEDTAWSAGMQHRHRIICERCDGEVDEGKIVGVEDDIQTVSRYRFTCLAKYGSAFIAAVLET